MEKKLLTIKEAAKEVGVGYQVIRRWCIENKFKIVTSGRKRYINRESLLKYVNEE